MRRLIPIACALLFAAAAMPAAGESFGITDWPTVCICKSGDPVWQGDGLISGFVQVTEENRADLRKKIDEGRLSRGQFATFRGKGCDNRAVTCSRGFNLKLFKFYRNVEVPGPLTVRIETLPRGLFHRPKGATKGRLNERYFQVGQVFWIQGKWMTHFEAEDMIKSLNRVTTWRPACICRSDKPLLKNIVTGIFRITAKNQAEIRRKAHERRLHREQRARLVGPACDTPKLCTILYRPEARSRLPDIPMAGPVTIRIDRSFLAPTYVIGGPLGAKYVESRIQVGNLFMIGGVIER